MSQRLRRPLGVALACFLVWAVAAMASLALEGNDAPLVVWLVVSLVAVAAVVAGVAALGVVAYRLIRD